MSQKPKVDQQRPEVELIDEPELAAGRMEAAAAEQLMAIARGSGRRANA